MEPREAVAAGRLWRMPPEEETAKEPDYEAELERAGALTQTQPYYVLSGEPPNTHCRGQTTPRWASGPAESEVLIAILDGPLMVGSKTAVSIVEWARAVNALGTRPSEPRS